MNSLSGENPSGPLIMRFMPASPIVGTRRTAPSMIGGEAWPVGREQLAVEVGGMPSSAHGAGSRS